MKTSIVNRTLIMAAAMIVTGIGCSHLMAADSVEEAREKRAEERRLSTIARTQTPVEGFESVEMFSGMSSGDVEVIIKAKDAADSTLIVKNTTDKPLAIEMPATFSAVPVLRQFGGGGFGGGGGGLGGGRGGGGGGIGGGQQQGIGGGIGGGRGGGGFGGGGGGRGGGGGGGVFNIPAGKSGKLKIKTVCLEHGKPEPRASMEYKVQPLATLESDPRVEETLRMLANDEIAQPVAQAAAWHVTDNLSWQQMLVLNRKELMGGYFERFFTPGQLQFAVQVVEEASRRAVLRAEENGTPKTTDGQYAYERENEESKTAESN